MNILEIYNQTFIFNPETILSIVMTVITIFFVCLGGFIICFFNPIDNKKIEKIVYTFVGFICIGFCYMYINWFLVENIHNEKITKIINTINEQDTFYYEDYKNIPINTNNTNIVINSNPQFLINENNLYKLTSLLELSEAHNIKINGDSEYLVFINKTNNEEYLNIQIMYFTDEERYIIKKYNLQYRINNYYKFIFNTQSN